MKLRFSQDKLRFYDWASHDANITKPLILRIRRAYYRKLLKIDNNPDPYQHFWRFDACCYRKST
jgi:hypothetical protein